MHDDEEEDVVVVVVAAAPVTTPSEFVHLSYSRSAQFKVKLWFEGDAVTSQIHRELTGMEPIVFPRPPPPRVNNGWSLVTPMGDRLITNPPLFLLCQLTTVCY